MQTALFHRPRDAVPPPIVHLSNRPSEFTNGGFDRQRIATDRSDVRCENAEQPGALYGLQRIEWFAGNDDAALAFTEQQRIQTVGRGC